MIQVPNGCGPSWMPRIIKDLLFNWFFEASCDRHDEGYSEGGDEVGRFECDWKFFLAMRRDYLRHQGIKRFLMSTQALLFFITVRAFGWTRFKYRQNRHD